MVKYILLLAALVFALGITGCSMKFAANGVTKGEREEGAFFGTYIGWRTRAVSSEHEASNRLDVDTSVLADIGPPAPPKPSGD